MPSEFKKFANEIVIRNQPNHTSTNKIKSANDLPLEVLANILGYVSFKTLLSCHLVCKHWLYTTTNYIWRKKAQEMIYETIPIDNSISWLQYYHIWCDEMRLNCNLITNHSGAKQFRHWAIIDTAGKFDKWIVEQPPVGVPSLPNHPVFEGQNSCFSASSASVCDKYQVIDLLQMGFSSKFLDNVWPVLQVSEWYSWKKDCYGYYTWKIQLIGDGDRFLREYVWKESGDVDDDNEWKCCQKEFRYCAPGLRKIYFVHRCEESKISPVTFALFGIRDRSYYQPIDRYGAKLAGACIKLLIPNSLNAKHKYQTSASLAIAKKNNYSIEHLYRPVRMLRL